MKPDSTAPSLAPWAWLSIAAAIGTFALKLLAWRLTGSVALLSDALETLANLAAAVIATLPILLLYLVASRQITDAFLKAGSA